jgi:hypothetical protein
MHLPRPKNLNAHFTPPKAAAPPQGFCSPTHLASKVKKNRIGGSPSRPVVI